MLESCGTPCGPRQHAGRGQSLHRTLLVFEVSALSSQTEGKTSFFSRRHADVMKTSTLSLRTLRATFPATRNMTWHGTRSQLNALRYVTLSMHHICADGFPGYEEGFGTRTCLYTLQDFETDDDGFSLWVLSWVCSSRSIPVSTFISMSFRGRGSIIGVLVLTNCCSVVLVPAPFEEYSVSSAQQSAGVSEARTTATPLLSTSSTSPSLVPHGPRPSIQRLALHTGLAAFPCCTSTWWFHVLRVLALSGTSVRRSNFASLLGISFRFSSGTLHYTRCVQQP